MKNNCKILVLDMQPIDPPIGGGRLRLLGLYHGLGLDTTYVGSFDWPGESYREHMLSPTLREIDVPLSANHYTAAVQLSQQLGNKVIIDSAFHRFAHLSKDYHEKAISYLIDADIVVFSHPWIYSSLYQALDRDRQFLIYDSQNHEGYLKFTLLDDNGGSGSQLAKEVVKLEFFLCQESDLILVCSNEDRRLFHQIYGIPNWKMAVVPNGVFTQKITPADDIGRMSAKKKLGLPTAPVAIFIGSNYVPNVEAAEFIISDIAPKNPIITFLVVGGVGDGLPNDLSIPENVHVTGGISEDQKIDYLHASDFALNPMFSGSGTNIKMFDFMAAGLPVVTTSVGARGIPYDENNGIFQTNRQAFASTVAYIAQNSSLKSISGLNARQIVEDQFSWEKISAYLGRIFQVMYRNRQENSRLRLALMSSIGATCGIAEYTNYLADALCSITEPLILLTTDEVYSIKELDSKISFYPVWHFDNKNWSESSIDFEAVRQTLVDSEINHLNIQYHPSFFSYNLLQDTLGTALSLGIKTSITLHNTRMIDDHWFPKLSLYTNKIFVHEQPEVLRLSKLGLGNIAHYLPQGLLNIPDEDSELVRRELGLGQDLLIGCFGFLRPHKGLLELIHAMPKVLEIFPHTKLLALNALYPTDDSSAYEKECREAIKNLNLQENIILITDFLPINKVVHFLHAVDINILPYHESGESASAAANICLSARRPLLVTASSIFNDIKQYCGSLPSIEPSVIADTLIRTLESKVMLNQLQSKANKAVVERNWNNIATKFIELINQWC